MTKKLVKPGISKAKRKAVKLPTVSSLLAGGNKVTAAIIEREPKPRFGTSGTKLADLQRIGREIRARVERLDRIGAKAVDMVDSISYLLREAEKLCDPDGFVAFKQCYCPELGRSRTYELLAIEQGRKTVEQIRAAGRERVAKHRAAQKNVTDNQSVTAAIARGEMGDARLMAALEKEALEAETVEETPPEGLSDVHISGVDNLRRAVEHAHLAGHYSPDELAAASEALLRRMAELPRPVRFLSRPPTILQLENEAAFLMKVAEAMRHTKAA